MRKIAVIFLLLVYGCAASGATLYLHYCCGKLDRISFHGSNKPSRMKCMSAKDCCDNKQIELKIKADQELVAKTFSEATSIAPAIAAVPSVAATPSLSLTVIPYDTGPPLARSSSAFCALYCLYRI